MEKCAKSVTKNHFAITHCDSYLFDFVSNEKCNKINMNEWHLFNSIRLVSFFSSLQLKTFYRKWVQSILGNGFPMFWPPHHRNRFKWRTIRILTAHGIFTAIKPNAKSYMQIFCCFKPFCILPSFAAIICYHFVAFDRWIDDAEFFFLDYSITSHANSAEKKRPTDIETKAEIGENFSA